ncbi:CK1 family protein kinase [Tritrichomonas foetus]|uniref:non-specific serine/threonine protein kinase n=1 Tax=Tritrichomonas foetus TaxID=1144522 RepID=A0A1J4K1W1_9EUKA|nr:CK1 family protein kinase [Tritrichomonas foetus]|eukprot:OHT04776.1 CK1 family protein kinase [Tritrichomonas foetus]
MDRCFGGRYKIKRKIGAGSFGEIFEGEDIKTGKRVAVKVEKLKTQIPQLNAESRVYSLLSGCTNAATLYYFGIEIQTCALVIDYLGYSLESLRTSCKGKLSIKTVLMLAPQMISAIEFLHKKNMIHGDIKPENFMLGLGNNENKVFMIDFGLSRNYRDPKTHQHIPFSEHKPFSGTARYSSIWALRGNEQSRRDDMEGLAYVWLWLLNGTVPWMNIDAPTLNAKYEKMCSIKVRSTPEQLFKNHPPEFANYLKEVRKLRFQDEPPYAKFRKMFYDLYIKMGYSFDHKYDWEGNLKENLSVSFVGAASPHANQNIAIMNTEMPPKSPVQDRKRRTPVPANKKMIPVNKYASAFSLLKTPRLVINKESSVK